MITKDFTSGGMCDNAYQECARKLAFPMNAFSVTSLSLFLKSQRYKEWRRVSYFIRGAI